MRPLRKIGNSKDPSMTSARHQPPRKNRGIRWMIVVFILLALAAVVFVWSRREGVSGSPTGSITAPGRDGTGSRPTGKAGTVAQTDLAATENVAAAASAVDAVPDVGELIADTSLSDPELVRRLSVIVLDEKSPGETRSEALAHLLNLTTEEDESILFTLAGSPRLNESLGDDLFRDALNRPLATQAELALVLLGRREPALQKEAQEHLVFLLDEDLGGNPKAWRKAVDAAKQKWSNAP
ncbi:hypothetical protein OPIT5_03275 [Opitutaceae bacterium TAV5]|nr:hypothetical protein OPIT5_03275 [Opitutaceae bacterium TAV5]